jgi:hypothetical protein
MLQLQRLFFAFWLFTIVACQQGFGNKENKTASPTLLSMEQNEAGKWVIIDSQKKVLYDVFIYDNGPDYPSEGLIRIIENGKIGYADANTYAMVIKPQFDCAFPFDNGKAKVSNKCQTVKEGEYSSWTSEEWTYVDKHGNNKAQ